MFLVPLLLSYSFAAATWQPMGPFGGAASFVAADPHHANTYLAAGNNGLLFRSADSGASWSPLRFPGQLRGVLHVLAVDPGRKDTYFAGMGGAEAAGLWITQDAGESWQPVQVLRGEEVWSLAFYPADRRVIAAGTKSGVHLSNDGGMNWRRISPVTNQELQPVVSLAFHPTNAQILYAGTPHLPWNTRDGGATWQSIHTGMLDDSDVFSIQVDHSNPKRVYATACSGLYASANSGALWAKLPGAVGASYRTYFITQHPKLANVLYAGTTRGLIKSENAGATWKALSTNVTRQLAFDPADPERILISTDDAGLLRSDNGGAKLTDANRGFCNRHLTVLAAGAGGLYTSTMYDASGGLFRLDGPGSWVQVAPASSLPGQQLLALAPSQSDGKLYAAAMNALVMSADSGKRWARVSSPPVRSLITSLLTAPAPATRLFLGTEQGLYRSEPAGLWKKIDLAGAAARIRALFTLDEMGIAALTPTQAFVSKDGAAFTPMAAPPEGVQLLAMANAGRGVLLAGTSHGILRSDDGGKSWQADVAGIRGTVSALCNDPKRPGVVYAAHYGEVYEIRAFDKTWRRISPEVSPLQSIRSLAIVPQRPGTLFALTARQGIFSLPLVSD